MPSATWNGAVIAQAGDDEVHIVENNVYFRGHVAFWKGVSVQP